MKTALFLVVLAVLVPVWYHYSTGRLTDELLNLQDGLALGSRPRRNYEGLVHFNADHYVEPEAGDAAHVQRIIVQAVQAKHRVKVVGAGHSWGTIAQLHATAASSTAAAFMPSQEGTEGTEATEGKKEEVQYTQMSLRKWRGVVEVDAAARLVTVQAGMRLYELADVLSQHGLALPAYPSTPEPTVGGILATATHGAGLKHSHLGSFLVAATLVDGQGQLVQVGSREGRLDELDERGLDVLRAVRANLGALGVLLEATFRCVPFHNTKEVVEPVTSGVEALMTNQAKLEAWIRGHGDYAKIWVLPTADLAVLHSGKPVSEDAHGNSPDWLLEVRITAFEVLQMLASHVRPLTSKLMRLAGLGYSEKVRVARWDNVYNIPHRIPQHSELEYSVPIEHSANVMKLLYAVIRKLDVSVNHIIEFRCVNGDDALLSPDYGRESCRVTLCLYGHAEDEVHNYFREFERTITNSVFKGRPHWAKWLYVDHTYLRSVLPEFDRFVAVRDELDPSRTFANAYLDQVLGQ